MWCASMASGSMVPAGPERGAREGRRKRSRGRRGKTGAAGLELLLLWRSTTAEGRLRSGGLDAGDVTTGEDDGGRGRARAGEALLLEGLGLGRDGRQRGGSKGY